jgi:hypothetical protein
MQAVFLWYIHVYKYKHMIIYLVLILDARVVKAVNYPALGLDQHAALWREVLNACMESYAMCVFVCVRGGVDGWVWKDGCITEAPCGCVRQIDR